MLIGSKQHIENFKGTELVGIYESARL